MSIHFSFLHPITSSVKNKPIEKSLHNGSLGETSSYQSATIHLKRKTCFWWWKTNQFPTWSRFMFCLGTWRDRDSFYRSLLVEWIYLGSAATTQVGRRRLDTHERHFLCIWSFRIRPFSILGLRKIIRTRTRLPLRLLISEMVSFILRLKDWNTFGNRKVELIYTFHLSWKVRLNLLLDSQMSYLWPDFNANRRTQVH